MYSFMFVESLFSKNIFLNVMYNKIRDCFFSIFSNTLAVIVMEIAEQGHDTSQI